MFAKIRSFVAEQIRWRYEEINLNERCPTYMYRFCLARFLGCAIYMHFFVKDDPSLDYHDHPRRFVSLMLWGQYRERTLKGDRIYRAPYLRTFPAEHTHRIEMIGHEPCLTLVLVLRNQRDWGFYYRGEWLHWLKYVYGPPADERTKCR
jgi:hypothetical protein